MKPFVPLVFAVSLLIYGMECYADDELEKATAFFNDGIELFDAGQFSEAAQKFREANQIRYNWKLLYNIAQCEAAARHHGLALQTFEEYLSRGGDDITMERREEVMSEIQRLREMVGYLEIHGPEGAMVFVDDIERDVLPLSGPLAAPAGVPLKIRLLLDDEIILEKEVRLPGKQILRITANPIDESTNEAFDSQPTVDSPDDGQPETDVASPALPAEDTVKEDMLLTIRSDSLRTMPMSPKRRRLQTFGIIGLGIGAAALVAGGVTGAIALKKGNDLEDKYGSEVPRTEESEYDGMQNLATASTISCIGGGAIATVGVVLLVVARTKTEHAAAVLPVAGKNMAALLLSGRF